MEYSTQELMIVAAAREISDGDVVFVGMRLPITAYGVARLTHAPDAVGLFECGVVRNAPAEDMLYTMGDPANQKGAAWSSGLIQVMGLLQRGRVDAGFIGGAQIDRLGNINTSCIGDIRAPTVRLPGSGGAADIAAMAKRLVVIMNHQKHRFVEKVDYVTSPGYLDGAGSREALGLAGGPTAVISDRCVLRPWGPNRELHVASLHPGTTLDDVQEHTAWPLATVPALTETPVPTAAELTALHAIDKDGFWRRSTAQ